MADKESDGFFLLSRINQEKTEVETSRSVSTGSPRIAPNSATKSGVKGELVKNFTNTLDPWGSGVSVGTFSRAAFTIQYLFVSGEICNSMNTTLKTLVAVAATGSLLNAAELTGKISVKGTPPPAKPITAVKADPNCGKSRTEDAMTRTWVVGAANGLANVVVYIKGGLEGKTFKVSEEKPLIDQVGCMYEPYVSAVQAGQTFDIRNSDALMHNVNAGPKVNKGFNFAQGNAGQVNPKSFPQAELGIKFVCNVHPWMIAYVNVIDNPFFAVSDKDGKFTIKGDLPDGKYTLAAFHQKGGEVTTEIEVKGGKATAAFEIEAKQ